MAWHEAFDTEPVRDDEYTVTRDPDAADWDGETEVVKETGTGKLKRCVARVVPGGARKKYRELTEEERTAYIDAEEEDLTVKERDWRKPASMKKRSAKGKARRAQRRHERENERH